MLYVLKHNVSDSNDAVESSWDIPGSQSWHWRINTGEVQLQTNFENVSQLHRKKSTRDYGGTIVRIVKDSTRWDDDALAMLKLDMELEELLAETCGLGPFAPKRRTYAVTP